MRNSTGHGGANEALGGRSQPEKGKIKIIFDNVL